MIKKAIKNVARELLGFIYFNFYRKNFPIIGNRALLYHAFGTKLKHDTYGISMELSKFKEQINFYSDNYNIINIRDYYLADNESLAITIDDGYKDNLDAIEILDKKNIPFTLYVTTNSIGKNNYLSENDIFSISNLGISTIGSHGCSHSRLSTLTNEKINTELKESKKVLEKITQTQIDTLSYPHGSYNNFVIDAAKKIGYKYAASSNKGINSRTTDNYLLRRSEIIQSDTINMIMKKINGYYDYY